MLNETRGKRCTQTTLLGYLRVIHFEEEYVAKIEGTRWVIMVGGSSREQKEGGQDLKFKPGGVLFRRHVTVRPVRRFRRDAMSLLREVGFNIRKQKR